MSVNGVVVLVSSWGFCRLELWCVILSMLMVGLFGSVVSCWVILCVVAGLMLLSSSSCSLVVLMCSTMFELFGSDLLWIMCCG